MTPHDDMLAGAVAEGRRTAFLRHGRTVPDDCSVAEALRIGGLDYEVEVVPIQTADGGEIPSRFAVRRTDTRRVFDVVGTGYQEVQNLAAFGVLEEFREVLGVRFGCAGTLANGRVAWVQVQLPNNFFVADADEHEMHMIVETSHDGKRAIRSCITPVRLDCRNQMNLAVRKARQRWAIRHTATAEARLAEAHLAMGYVEEYQREFKTQTQKLLAYKVSDKSLVSLLEGVMPARPSREREVAAIVALAKEGPTNDFGRGTGYAALQATREYYDHVRPTRTAESAFIGAQTGVNKRVTDRVFAALLARAEKRAA
jgi:phage/plasmid-like protein (TIGR03299 family)